MPDRHGADALTALLQTAGLPPAESRQGVGGGDIAESFQVLLDDGRRLFVKLHPRAAADFFPAEAEGLKALGAAAAGSGLIRVPEVHYAGTEGLILEWLEAAPKRAGYWERFGAGLAGIHGHPQSHFGFSRDNYCGLTPQPNPPMADGYRFFAEARLQHQARLARNAGLLTTNECRKIDRLCERLERWIPVQPPALIHGDLWTGNAHTGPVGEPVLVDPAAHYGWAEAELAMTTLFGRLPDAFYASYRDHYPVAPDWEERAPLYNLYHLLNHLNLFGGGYHRGVRDVLDRWS